MIRSFSNEEEVRSQTGEFLTRAIDHLKQDIDNLELETIQACVLVGNTLGHDGSYDLESLYFGTTNRLCTIELEADATS